MIRMTAFSQTVCHVYKNKCKNEKSTIYIIYIILLSEALKKGLPCRLYNNDCTMYIIHVFKNVIKNFISKLNFADWYDTCSVQYSQSVLPD